MALCGLAGMALGDPALAAGPEMGKSPSECAIALALLGQLPPGCPPMEVRAAPVPRPLPAPAAPSAAVLAPSASAVAPTPAPPSVPAVIPLPPVAKGAVARRADFQIEFDFGSARIDPASRKLLDRVAAVIGSKAAGAATFRIVGHTDAVGEAGANRALSARRAAAVKTYLVDHHHIASARLETEGVGADHPVNPANPKAGENRRVEIINLGGEAAK